MSRIRNNSVLALGLIYSLHTPQRCFNVGLKLNNLKKWNGTITFVWITTKQINHRQTVSETENATSAKHVQCRVFNSHLHCSAPTNHIWIQIGCFYNDCLADTPSALNIMEKGTMYKKKTVNINKFPSRSRFTSNLLKNFKSETLAESKLQTKISQLQGILCKGIHEQNAMELTLLILCYHRIRRQVHCYPL